MRDGCECARLPFRECAWDSAWGRGSVALVLLVGIMFITLVSPARGQFTCASATTLAIGSSVSDSNFNPSGATRWFTLTPTVTGKHVISTCGSAIDTQIALFDACNQLAMATDNDTCGDDAVLVINLVAGTTYYLRVADGSVPVNGPPPGGAFQVFVTPPQPEPFNPICSLAQVLPLNVPVGGALGGAGLIDNSTCGAADTISAWYSFQAPVSGTYWIQVCSQQFQPVLSTQSNCLAISSAACDVGTARVACSNLSGQSVDAAVSSLAITQSAGGVVFVRVGGLRGSFGSFRLVVYQPQSNNLCVNARPLSLGSSPQEFLTPQLARNGDGCTIGDARTLWYVFNPPAAGAYTFSTCGGGSSTLDTVLSLHTACPGTPGQGLLACSDNACNLSSAFAVNLAAGTLYYLRLAAKGTPGFGRFELSVSAAGLANDECAGAFALIEGRVLNGTTVGATTSSPSPSCAASGGTGADVWYNFVPETSGTYEFSTCGSVLATVLTIYSGCSNAELACASGSSALCGAGGTVLSASLTAGQSYALRVRASSNVNDGFVLTAKRTAAPNDSCDSPRPLALGVVYDGTFTGTTASGFAACASGGAADPQDVWFSFTPAATRWYRVSTCGSLSPTSVAIHAACGPATELACSPGPTAFCVGSIGSDVIALLSSGTTYQIRVSRALSPGGMQEPQAAYRVLVENAPSGNDVCSQAIPMALGQLVTGSNQDATSDNVSCAGSSREVYYRFIAPQATSYLVRTCTSVPLQSGLDTVVSVFSACGGSLLGCNNDSASCAPGTLSSVVVALAAGQEVLISVGGAGSQQGLFALEVVFAPPSNDNCSAATVATLGANALNTFGAVTENVTSNTGTGCQTFGLLSRDVWFRFVRTQSSRYAFATCGTSFDAAVIIMNAADGCPTGSGVVPALACSDDAACPPLTLAGNQARAVVALRGTLSDVLVRVGSRSGASGTGTLTITRICDCDWDANELVSVPDIFLFLGDWFNGAADFDGNGTTEVPDIFVFLTCWFGACG